MWHVACLLPLLLNPLVPWPGLLFLLRYLFWPIEATNHKLHFTILIDQNAVVGVGVFKAFCGLKDPSVPLAFPSVFQRAFRSGPWLFALAANYYYYYLFEIKYH